MPRRDGSRAGENSPDLSRTGIDKAEAEAASGDRTAIDRLLGATEETPDVGDQAQALQQASGVEKRPSGPPSKGPPPLAAKGSKGPPPLPPGARSRESSAPPPSLPLRMASEPLRPDSLIDFLQARAVALEAKSDMVGLARAHLELAIASEAVLGDGERATIHLQAALRANPQLAPAHGILRRINHRRTSLSTMLEHLEHEILASATDAQRSVLLAEKARLLQAIGGRTGEARAAWEQALGHTPNDAAALKGLEEQLTMRALATGAPRDWDALAGHLGRMADAYASEADLAAWLHVERARILERKLDRVDAARSALERALELDPKVGPVRTALVQHVAAHGDWGRLANLLEEEARLDSDGLRAARNELDAALIVAWRLGERRRACTLLERAAARAPTAPAIDRRVLDELVRLNEMDGQWTDAARARRARLSFITDVATSAYELRVLATIAERTGSLEMAIGDLQQALALDATDAALVLTLDRLLATADRQDQRIAVWLQHAAGAEDDARRARSLLRAAEICEEVGQREAALRHLRAAWVAAPGDDEVLDGLARLLAPSLAPSVDARARDLVELYSQAAEQAVDPGRKVSYLERAALVFEELLTDPKGAARAYERVLSIEGDRRSAIVGLERTAARIGNAQMLARAFLDEARVSSDKGSQITLRTRAATALAKYDPARAIQLIREVLEQDATNAAARALETRLYEDAGRWELAAQSLRSRIQAAVAPSERVALWLALAQLQQLRLFAPAEALASLERARALDPAHPVPREEIARALESHGDARALRDAVERLAGSAPSPEERVRHLVRSAEIEELRLGDDAAALRAYQRALVEMPDDDLVAQRLARLLARRARERHADDLAEFAAPLEKQIRRATSPEVARGLSFDLGCLLSENRQEAPRATALLEAVIDEEPDHIPALRTLEGLWRKAPVDVTAVARVLRQQAKAFTDTRARLGALWSLAAMEEWDLPSGDAPASYRAILELDPADTSALLARLRCELATASPGSPSVHPSAITALRAIVPLAATSDERLALQIHLVLMLETAAAQASNPSAGEELLKEALERCRDALSIDDLSAIASTGLARIAGRLGDDETALAASQALAQLADDPRTRARCLLDGAEILLAASDESRLGSRAERYERAASLLERAFEADPDSIPVAGRLATVLLEEHQAQRVVSLFRMALDRAKSRDTLVMLGSEIARVARHDLNDIATGIDALRRVRAAVPQHLPSLLTLAELCIAQRAWPEAVDVLESAAASDAEAAMRLTALFALASIYEKVIVRPIDLDRVLRTALTIDPSNPRALLALIRRLTAEPMGRDEAAAERRRKEISELLSRLADVETDAERKTGILVELSEVNLRLGDVQGAKNALIEAAAAMPSNGRAFSHLEVIFRHGDDLDRVGFAQALSEVIQKGERLGQTSAHWFAALGRIEVQDPSTVQIGLSHLERAVEMDPTLYKTRFEVATRYAQQKASDKAARVLIDLLAPTAQPLLGLDDPPGALALLETSLVEVGRTDEATVVSELRALAGDLDAQDLEWLRGRPLPPLQAAQGTLGRTTLVAQVVPSAGRHVLLEVAAAIAGIQGKILRSDLSELGITPRDRVTARSGHPTRILFDRVCRLLGVDDVELVIAARATRTRVLSHDEPWVVIPAALVDQGQPAQLASISRALARLALGVPWLDELPAKNILALLVAAARQVAAGYAPEEPGLAGPYEASLSRVLARRQRKLLEELAPRLASPQASLPAPDEFVRGLFQAEVRTQFLITGDIQGAVEEEAERDPALAEATAVPGGRALAATLLHPLVGDVVRFALTPEATGLRRRVGSVWSRSRVSA